MRPSEKLNSCVPCASVRLPVSASQSDEVTLVETTPAAGAKKYSSTAVRTGSSACRALISPPVSGAEPTGSSTAAEGA